MNRYIIWLDSLDERGLKSILAPYVKESQALKIKDGRAVVQIRDEVADRIHRAHPVLRIELDVQHHPLQQRA